MHFQGLLFFKGVCRFQLLLGDWDGNRTCLCSSQIHYSYATLDLHFRISPDSLFFYEKYKVIGVLPLFARLRAPHICFWASIVVWTRAIVNFSSRPAEESGCLKVETETCLAGSILLVWWLSCGVGSTFEAVWLVSLGIGCLASRSHCLLSQAKLSCEQHPV